MRITWKIVLFEPLNFNYSYLYTTNTHQAEICHWEDRGMELSQKAILNIYGLSVSRSNLQLCQSENLVYRTSLNSLSANNFPLRSTEFPKGSPKYQDYITAIDRVGECYLLSSIHKEKSGTNSLLSSSDCYNQSELEAEKLILIIMMLMSKDIDWV